jgi:hypothetical protein
VLGANKFLDMWGDGFKEFCHLRSLIFLKSRQLGE